MAPPIVVQFDYPRLMVDGKPLRIKKIKWIFKKFSELDGMK
jgi:hypothetical protein